MTLHLTEEQKKIILTKIESGVDKGLKEYIREELNSQSVRIVNAEGTTDDEHPDNTTTWKEYWEKRTGVELDKLLPKKGDKYLCPTHSHHEKGDDGYVEAREICGCHVHIVDANGRVDKKKMFIAPMCSGCNQRNEIFKLPKEALVEIHPIRRK